jgi:hypothetical protein
MTFWNEINDGKGYDTDVLTADELDRVRRMIAAQYLENLGTVDADLVGRAASVGIDNYHTLPLPFEHGSFWSKERRVLPERTLPVFERMGFFRRIRAALPSAEIYHDDLMWRVVRPNEPSDVGPVHADKWFWDAGNGSIEANRDRLKIWIAVYTEAGLNGLTVKPHSHTSDRWKRHFELRHGRMKPVLDESAEELGMELLPLTSGEMVLFHDALLHGGALNRGSTCRVSIELTITFLAEDGLRLNQSKRKAAA